MAVRTKRSMHDAIAVFENGVQLDWLWGVPHHQARRGTQRGGADKTGAGADPRPPPSITMGQGGKEPGPGAPPPNVPPPVETSCHDTPAVRAERGMVNP